MIWTSHWEKAFNLSPPFLLPMWSLNKFSSILSHMKCKVIQIKFTLLASLFTFLFKFSKFYNPSLLFFLLFLWLFIGCLKGLVITSSFLSSQDTPRLNLKQENNTNSHKNWLLYKTKSIKSIKGMYILQPKSISFSFDVLYF